MIKIGKVIGDVIEAGGVKNVTNNYYGKEDAHDDGGGKDVTLKDDTMPDQLRGEHAEELMERLVDAGMLTDEWQPTGLSGTEKALVARALGERLEIAQMWQVFGKLWHMKPETFRTYHNKALDQRKTLDFQDRLKKILG